MIHNSAVLAKLTAKMIYTFRLENALIYTQDCEKQDHCIFIFKTGT